MYSVKIKGTILDIDCGNYQSNLTRRQIVKLIERHPKYAEEEVDVWGMMNHLKEELRELEREIQTHDIKSALYEIADMANCLDKLNILLEKELEHENAA